MLGGYELRKLKVNMEGARTSKKMRVGRRRDTGLVSLLNPSEDIASIIESNSLESPLLSLPPELRNRIFELILGGSEILIKSEKDSDRKASGSALKQLECLKKLTNHTVTFGAVVDSSDKDLVAYLTPEDSPHNILCVCRQIYHECSTIMYALNTFDFATPIAFEIWYAYRKQAQPNMVRRVKVSDDILFVTKNGRLGLQALTTMFPKLKTVVMGKYRYRDSTWKQGIRDEHMMYAWGDVAVVKQGERDDLEVVFEPLYRSWKK